MGSFGSVVELSFFFLHSIQKQTKFTQKLQHYEIIKVKDQFIELLICYIFTSSTDKTEAEESASQPPEST